MATLKKVDFNPFEGVKLKPVAGNPFAGAEPQSGVFTITPGGMIDQATWDRLQREKPQVAANLLEEHSADAVARDVTTGQAIRIGAGKSFADLGTGVRQIYNAATDNPNADRYTREIQSDLNAYKTLADQKPIATGAGELLGDIAATAPIPMGTAALSLRGLGAAAGVNAGIAGVEFTPEGDSRLGNAAMGGAMGAAGHTVMATAGKTINALRGRMRNAREQGIWDTARANNIPLTAGDVTQNPKLQAIDGMMERIAIVGNAGLRTKQAERATAMLGKLRDDYVRYVGGDAPDELKDSLFRRLNESKARASQLYDEAAQLAGDAPVLTQNLSSTARALIQREQQNIPNEAMQSSGLVSLLSKYTDDSGLTFEGARKLRSRLKADIRNAHKNAVIGTEDVAIANRLVDGIETDIADFARQQGGGLAMKLGQADRFYRQQVVPFKDQLLARTMKDDNIDLNIEQWLRNPARMRTVYSAADEKGRGALRLALLDKAMTFANVGPPGQEYISPERFTQQIRAMQRSVGEVFKGEDRKRLDGTVRLLQHMRGVDRSRRVEATGMGAQKNALMLGSSIGAGGMVAAGALDPVTALAGAGSLGVLRAALSSNAGARLLSAAADMRDSKQLSYIWDSLRRIAERNASILDGTQPPDPED